MSDRPEYNCWHLGFLDELSRRAFGRLTRVVQRAPGGPSRWQRRLRAELHGALRRKLAQLAAAFPQARRFRPEQGPPSALLRQLRRAHVLWVGRLDELLDDGELSVGRHDPHGRLRPTSELFMKAALDDAELSGRIAQDR